MDSGFHSIVDYLLEAVGMRLGFDFIGVEGGVSVDSGGMFPNHLDSGFHSIVDYLLEAVASMRLIILATACNKI